MEQKFSFHWNNHLSQMTSTFETLRNEESLVDVTLSCEGKSLKAHKILLSASSLYFLRVFKENPCHHPVIVFQNVKYVDLEALVDFIYKGEVNIIQEQLQSFLDTAVLLEVCGLIDGSGKNNSSKIEEDTAALKSWRMCEQELVQEKNPVLSRNQQPPIPPIKKRKHSPLTICADPPERKPKLGYNEIHPVEKLHSVEDPKYNEGTVIASTSTDSLQPLSIHHKSDSSVELSMHIKHHQDQLDNSIHDLGGCVDSMEEVDNETQSNKTIEGGLKLKGILSESVPVVDSSASNSNSVNCLLENNSTSFSTDSKGKVESNIKSGSLEIPSHTSNVEKSTQKCIVPNPLLNSKGCGHRSEDLTSSSHTITNPSNNQRFTEIINLEYEHAVETDDNYSALRSEEVKEHYHDDWPQSHSDQQFEVPEIANVTDEIGQDEPEVVKEVPDIDCEQTTVEEKKNEPPLNNFGCEICKSELKQMDKSNFTHKCPICPCISLCSHLLKEHMKFVHGWFNVQRRFNQY